MTMPAHTVVHAATTQPDTAGSPRARSLALMNPQYSVLTCDTSNVTSAAYGGPPDPTASAHTAPNSSP